MSEKYSVHNETIFILHDFLYFVKESKYEGTQQTTVKVKTHNEN